MRQDQRQGNRAASPGGGSDDQGSDLDQLREQGSRFLAAGDEAINRALASCDSETFLRANQQQGGE